jgi:hypothetical protein
MAEKSKQQESLEFLQQVASVIPAGLLTREQVDVLVEIANEHLRQRIMMQELGVDSLAKSGGDMTLYADDGVQIVGRNVEKQAVNFRLEKPLLELIATQAEYLDVKKADLVRLALWQFVQRNNIANKASKVEGEATPDAAG